MDIVKKIEDMHIGDVIPNVDIKKCTTYKVGGHALALVSPYTISDLQHLLSLLKKEKMKYKVIGFGSNLIFNDGLYNGILIRLDNLDGLTIRDRVVTVGAGYSLMKLSLKTARLGLSGLEFASGIPGSIGGAIFMNAGAYNSDMGYVVRSIRVLTPELEVKTMYNYDLDFHYRSSFLQKNPGYICLEAKIILKHGNIDEITELISNRRKRRLETQPLEYPSAGSVFRNPEGMSAWSLIEEVGYKGKHIGDAYVSEKHANFIINKGHATGEDVKQLITDIREKVKKEKGITLKIEQEFVE
ncbi:MAG TPA: UDP-N-acetylmuramate dehydrogenase [Candidatus Pelethosoma merdigallinarum]|nr:UDP-N-acetylmuramate dehydrogenase [Candidatus Pelethosoma merdigallinarum]